MAAARASREEEKRVMSCENPPTLTRRPFHIRVRTLAGIFQTRESISVRFGESLNCHCLSAWPRAKLRREPEPCTRMRSPQSIL